MKRKLLVMELWGLGDLSIAGRFLQAAVTHFDVTLLAKPNAVEFGGIFCPEIRVIPFTAPWTAFRRKYQLHRWPWRELNRLSRQLRKNQFEFGVSVRPDPRDHICLAAFGVKERLGFPRLGSGVFLTRRLARPDPMTHRFRGWQLLADELGFSLPDPAAAPRGLSRTGSTVVIHSGAAQPTRIWPLERFAALAARIRSSGLSVQVVCDPAQHSWWLSHQESQAVAPRSPAEYAGILSQSLAFIGNDSGPGHVAALSGVPTFTVFGPVFPRHYAPLHAQAEWSEGKDCPYKPCFDSCRFSSPHCLLGVETDEVWPKVQAFLGRIQSATR